MGPGGIDLGDMLVGLFVATFVVMPMATLAHELGHAFVALRVADGPVVVHVGRPPAFLEIAFQRLKIAWSPIPPRGVPFSGLCVWRADTVGHREQMMVALVGPLVTLLLIPVFALAMVATLGMPEWIPATWGVSALAAFASCLFNLDPRYASDAERGGRVAFRRDGPRALAEYRAWRAASPR